MEHNTPKQFVLQLGSLISLYLSLAFLLLLAFGTINLMLPDAANDYVGLRGDSQDMVRFGAAMVIVFFPTYLVLTRLVNQARRQAPQGAYLTLTKWLIYLSLLVGGIVLLVDLVAVINTYLGGEITSRFLLKASAVLLVVGAAFFYYIQDARGFWVSREGCAVRFGALASVLVLMTVLTGFWVIDPPSVVREQRIDETQITDLSNIQDLIQNHLAIHNELPASLADLGGGVALPEAPAGRAAYTYERTDQGFMLCATFAADSEFGTMAVYSEPVIIPDEKDGTTTLVIINPYAWDHPAGEFCFERVVR